MQNKHLPIKKLFRKWKDENYQLVISYALLGATNEEIAGFLHVDPETFQRWIKENPRLVKCLQEGREAADARVARSLHSRAVGYTYNKKVPVRTKTKLYDESGKVVGEQEVTEYIDEEVILPPDVQAGKFWLGRRRRKDWEEKSTVELDTKDGKPLPLDITIRFADKPVRE